MTRFLIALAALIAACSPAPPAPVEAPPPGSQIAVFAGGCFWSAEKAFENVRGVSSVVSGFAGGTVANPTYAQVVRGGTGHREAIQVTFDPNVVSYRALVDRFWRTIDPTDPGGAFCDRGPSYETAVFARFWPAGNEHQDYARRNPGRYEAYRIGCRRSPALRRVWGDATVE